MTMFPSAVLAAALALAATGPQPGTGPAPPVLSTSDGVADGARDDGGGLWFGAWDRNIGFLLPAGDRGGTDAVFALLREAAAQARTLVIRFDPASGRYDAVRRRVMYRLCAISGGDVVLGKGDALCPPAGGRSADPLALGVAFHAAGQGSRALPLLDAALRSGPDRDRRLVALRVREGARRAAAYLVAAGLVRDRLLLAALDDARAWTALAPDDAEAQLATAADLAELGAYPDAIAAYRRIGSRWPDEALRAAVRVAAIRRGQGDAPAALAELDGLVAAHGTQAGMKFHYHRGWVLTLLGRDEEAMAELTSGLADQPDYPWALVRRACVLGRLGQVQAAAADQRTAVAGLARLISPQVEMAAEQRADLGRAEAVAGTLERLATTDPHGRTDAGCTGYSDPDTIRTRSPVLR